MLNVKNNHSLPTKCNNDFEKEKKIHMPECEIELGSPLLLSQNPTTLSSQPVQQPVLYYLPIVRLDALHTTTHKC